MFATKFVIQFWRYLVTGRPHHHCGCVNDGTAAVYVCLWCRFQSCETHRSTGHDKGCKHA